MEATEKLSELIPVKVTKSMAAEITTIAGSERKRAEYIRSLIEKDRVNAREHTKKAALAARVVAAVEKDPGLEPVIDSVLSKSTRRRLVPA